MVSFKIDLYLFNIQLSGRDEIYNRGEQKIYIIQLKNIKIFIIFLNN